jgi:plastocyanin
MRGRTGVLGLAFWAAAVLVSSFLVAPGASAVTYGPSLPRATSDRPDGGTGGQVHIIYVLPSDGVDHSLDTNGTLKNTVSSFQTWLDGQTPGRSLRFDTYQGSLDISFYRMTRTNADIANEGALVRDAIEDETTVAGFDAPNKIYAVYYDGKSKTACGGGAWPPTLPGNVAALYLNGLPNDPNPCRNQNFAAAGGPPTYWEFAMLHEILHTLGFVATCAPNHTRAGHTSENGNDLMWSGNGSWFPDGYAAAVLDFGRDDYYDHSNSGCLDFADSTFLTGGGGPGCATSIAVSSSTFTPKMAQATQGGCVVWSFSGPGNHSVTETKKIGSGTTPLFNSGPKSPGTTFSFPLAAAATYNYRSTVTGDPSAMSGVVKVPVKVSATTGGVSTQITVTWAASAAAPGFRSDVQVRHKPVGGSYGPWTEWRSDQTGASAAFSANAQNGTGDYQFRARLENAGTLKASGWSSLVTVKIR